VAAAGFDTSDPWIQLVPHPAHGHGHTPAITPLKQITIRCVARWADRYEFWPVGHTSHARKGQVATDANERDAQLAKLYAWVRTWLQRSPLAGYELVGVLLYSGDRVILDMHDGDLGHLMLTQAQAEELSVCWQRFGLPPDLYIPAPPLTWD
jgi:hypothetical protein